MLVIDERGVGHPLLVLTVEPFNFPSVESFLDFSHSVLYLVNFAVEFESI